MPKESKTLGAYVIAKTDPVKKVREAYQLAKECQRTRRDQWTEIYLNYHGYLREKFKKLRRSNFHYHKIFPQVELEASRMTIGQFSHKPFVSVQPSNGTAFDIAQNRERVLQYYFEHCPAWYLTSQRLLKYTLLYGCGFRIPSWKRIKRKTEKVIDLEIYGYRYKEKIMVEETVYDGLWFEVLSPTEVFPHPHGLTLEEKPWVIIEQFLPAQHLLEMAQSGAFDLSKVKQIPLNMSGQNEIQYYMRQSQMGYEQPKPDEGIIRLQHFIADDHFITLANDETIIRDVDNFYYHKTKPIVQGIKTLDPDSFYPIAMAKMILPAQKFGNLLLDMAGDNAIMNNWPIWKHKANVDPNWLISVPNQRIPVEEMDDVDIVRMPEMKQDILQLNALIASSIEETTGYFGPQKGFSPRVHSATSDTIFASQGDQRIQYDGMTYEKCTLLPEAKICASLVEQFMPEQMQVYMDGSAQGGQYQWISKEEICGEFLYRVSGISESIRRAARRADLVELVRLGSQTQQYVRLVTGEVIPAPLQNNRYALKTLYQSFDREDAERFMIPAEVFGIPLDTGQNDVLTQVASILNTGGAERLLGRQANPELGNLPEASRLSERAPTQPYQLLGA
ncbi:MAG: hypothetical protein AB1690_02475 [Candidatus Zixiibacteriota bacterium]